MCFFMGCLLSRSIYTASARTLTLPSRYHELVRRSRPVLTSPTSLLPASPPDAAAALVDLGDDLLRLGVRLHPVVEAVVEVPDLPVFGDDGASEVAAGLVHAVLGRLHLVALLEHSPVEILAFFLLAEESRALWLDRIEGGHGEAAIHVAERRNDLLRLRR